MRFKPPNCKRLQGAADARRRARRRTFVLQVPDNKADAVPCERLRKKISVKWLTYCQREFIPSFTANQRQAFIAKRNKAAHNEPLVYHCLITLLPEIDIS
mgnify:CR=1 FL=1